MQEREDSNGSEWRREVIGEVKTTLILFIIIIIISLINKMSVIIRTLLFPVLWKEAETEGKVKDWKVGCLLSHTLLNSNLFTTALLGLVSHKSNQYLKYNPI